MMRCPRVVQIERADELSPDLFNGCSVAGLTAGASTPAGIIKEVYAAMSEEIKAAEGKEESFEELLNQSFKTLNNGDRVTGIVTAITPTEVQVDVGAKQAAYNAAHGIVPKTIVKGVRELLEISGDVDKPKRADGVKMTEAERRAEITRLEAQMKKAAEMLEYEYAAVLRDRLIELRGQ